MPKETRKYLINGREREFHFAPLSNKFMRENAELLKRAVVRSAVDDLVEQNPIITASMLRAVPLEGRTAEHKRQIQEAIDELDVPDVLDAIRTAMEASGWRYVVPGEGDPAKA